jgi:ABC-type lipoprotein export system ATPase subunit
MVIIHFSSILAGCASAIKIGFIFQDHCLLPQCSVIENVDAHWFLKITVIKRLVPATCRTSRLAERIDHQPAGCLAVKSSGWLWLAL